MENAQEIGTKQKHDKRKLRAVELLAKGLSENEVASALDFSQSKVARIKKEYSRIFKTLPRVSDYRATKSDLLAAGQLAALESAFSGNKLQKAGFLSTLQGFDLLNKAERLENNQSTSNLSVTLGTLSMDTRPAIDITPTQETPMSIDSEPLPETDDDKF